ncbi:5-Nucleotidase [Seminavis robusta]|uniref:5-Nucleotidase n=1 Tax=Seminavis robusta TaxID=568900 RepID=A0A9N8HGB4_9STRA|nr:5-Nucleotidase [Seminavis robusta]|eukprot:Sro623_g177170.1 5-Nucleotidase (602) ;mRNA; r:35209-37251
MSSSSLAKLRLVAINDVYELTNLPKFQTFLKQLEPKATGVLLAGDFLSPSTLSSIDGGRGMVATLKACGLTHVCLGNHEADLHWPQLHSRMEELCRSSSITANAQQQAVTFVNTNLREPPPDAKEKESWWMTGPMAPPYAIVPTPCGRASVALLGLLSDEKRVFRDETFRGAPIANVLTSFQTVYEQLVGKTDFVIPMTHMSMKRDKELAMTMLNTMQNSNGLIIGGHEHEPYNVKIWANGETDEENNGDNHNNSSTEDPYIQILKSGTDAQGATLIDLTFDVSEKEHNNNITAPLVDIQADIVSMEPYQPSVVVSTIVEERLKVVSALDEETIINAETLLPPGIPLSSQRSRQEQTTVGAILCKAIKDELGSSVCDVALINGATIKGGRMYNKDRMSYADLKKELPFPTKMVVVPMKRWELLEAIYYSRRYNEEGVDTNDNDDIPRRGYLQVDLDFDMDRPAPLDDTVRVALPRNLMAGFCQIKPLMDLGKQLKDEGVYPDADDFIPAIQVIIRHFCKSMWLDIVKESFTFEDIDLNKDGMLDREEIKIMMQKFLGHEPPDFVVDDMIDAIDADEDGVIDAGEFSFLLATMEREDIFRKL